MDIHCPVCGEPWDNDEVHEVASVRFRQEYGYSYDYKREGDPERYRRFYNQAAAEFRQRGCEALGAIHGDASTQRDKTFGLTRAEAAGALYDLLGDDMDGAAAMMEDMGF